ncbi:DUF4328 domain-containing protein [Streptomyces sp. NBC_00243]|uniref:DUF4328 domain-containing protein n=1 Tax=Streptomyces sp. NBC_00243 TaxID=2975688 RepID=UPI002DD9EEE5|nr:DUF4328 domain-containing protein [Streptomyces sp. NBC_00243]WRZ20235.1 DUF4328 domain-containing protein [Streptomyces sp. NBC_00243]
MFCKKCYFATASMSEGLCADCADEAASESAGVPAPAPLPAAPPLPTGPMTLPHGPAWLRPPVGLGKSVAILLGLVIATDLFAIWADLNMYDVTGSMADGDFSDAVQRDAEHADTVYAVAGYTQMTSLVAAIVVYLIWFQRMRVNAEVFNPFGHSKRRAWVIWGWFVPIVNLWFPRRVMLDIWDASTPVGSRGSHGLVNAWWTLWIISLIADRAGSTSYRKAETPQELQDATGQIMLADVMDIAAAVLAILVVLRLTRMQNEKAHQGQGFVPAGV